jgi:hypothetical protein
VKEIGNIDNEARSWNAQDRARNRKRTIEAHEDADEDEDNYRVHEVAFIGFCVLY